MPNSDTLLLSRIELVAQLLHHARARRVTWPMWELDEALVRVADAKGPYANVARRWRVPRPFGDAFPGLARVLGELIRYGVLVRSGDLGCYVVDHWRVNELLGQGPPPQGVDAAARWLAQRDQKLSAASNP